MPLPPELLVLPNANNHRDTEQAGSRKRQSPNNSSPVPLWQVRVYLKWHIRLPDSMADLRNSNYLVKLRRSWQTIASRRCSSIGELDRGLVASFGARISLWRFEKSLAIAFEAFCDFAHSITMWKAVYSLYQRYAYACF